MPGSELDSKVQRKGKVIRKVAYSFFHSYTFDSHYHSNMIREYGHMVIRSYRRWPTTPNPIHSYTFDTHSHRYPIFIQNISITIAVTISGGSGAQTKFGLPSYPDAPGAHWGGQEKGEVN